MKNENLKKITDVINEGTELKDVVNGDLKGTLVGEVIDKSSSAKFSPFAHIKNNTTELTDEELRKKQINALKFCVFLCIPMILGFIFVGDGNLPKVLGGTILIPFGLYGFVKKELLISAGVARQSLLLGIKARIGGAIFISLGIMCLFL